MFTLKPQEYTDPLTGEMKKKQMKFFPDAYKNRIGKSYNDYIADHQMNMFEDFIGYQGSAVLDEPEQKTDTISVPIPQCEESENIPLPAPSAGIFCCLQALASPPMRCVRVPAM